MPGCVDLNPKEMFELTVRPNTGHPDHASIVIQGEITLTHADRIFQELRSISETYPSIEINLEQVENTDISAIQLIFAARKTFKDFKVQAQLGSDLEALLEHAGLLNIIN